MRMISPHLALPTVADAGSVLNLADVARDW